MAAPRPIRVPTRRISTTRRSLLAAGVAAGVALILLAAHIFSPRPGLQIAALWSLGFALLGVWAAVLTWRIPIYRGGQLAGLAAVWLVGIGLAVLLVLISEGRTSPLWRHSVEWLALTLSLAVGALFLRALLRVRTVSTLGRLLPLVSPLGILVLILVRYATQA